MAVNTAPWGWMGSSYHELARLEVVLVRQDDLNNRSLFRVIIGNNSNNSYGDTGTLTYSLKDQSATRYGGSRGNTPTSGYNQSREYARHEFWINHNNDGTLSNRVFTLTMTRTAGNVRTVTVVVNINNIRTIPRESKITALNNVTLPGDNPTFTIDANSSSYRHSADLKMDGVTIATMNGLTAGTHSFNLTQSQISNILSRIPNDTKRTYQVVVGTYNGGHRVGNFVSRNATVTVANSVVPTINDILVTNYIDDDEYSGPYIQNKTQVGITVNSSGIYMSRITSTRITFMGMTYNNSVDRTPIITSNGLLDVTVEVTDSRGRKATQIKTIKVLPYQRPQIENLWANRAVREMIGKPPMPHVPHQSPDGKWLVYGMYIDVSPMYQDEANQSNPLNTSLYKVEYRERTSETWVTLDEYEAFQYWFDHPQWGTSISVTEILDPNISYEVRFILEDMFERLERVITIPTAFTLIDFHSDGKNLAIGKVSEQRGFEVNMPVYAYDEMKQNDGQPIMSDAGQGVSDGWSFMKFSTGLLFLYRELDLTVDCTNTWGSLFTSGLLANSNLTYPSVMKPGSVKTCFKEVVRTGSNNFIQFANGAATQTRTGGIELARGTSGTNIAVKIFYQVWAEWS